MNNLSEVKKMQRSNRNTEHGTVVVVTVINSRTLTMFPRTFLVFFFSSTNDKTKIKKTKW